MNSIVKLKQRIAAQGIWSVAKYSFLTVFLEKVGFEINSIFLRDDITDTLPLGDDQSFEIIDSPGRLSGHDLDSLREYGGEKLLKTFENAFRAGEICAIGRHKDELGCMCWVKRLDRYQDITGDPLMFIWRCATMPRLRGKGLYPRTLSYACGSLQKKYPAGLRILAECSISNIASVKGIEKAGFKRIGSYLVFRSYRKYMLNGCILKDRVHV